MSDRAIIRSKEWMRLSIPSQTLSFEWDGKLPLTRIYSNIPGFEGRGSFPQCWHSIVDEIVPAWLKFAQKQ
jgi:hypothetical protein